MLSQAKRIDDETGVNMITPNFVITDNQTNSGANAPTKHIMIDIIRHQNSASFDATNTHTKKPLLVTK